MQVRSTALAALRVRTQVQVDQVKPAELADPQAPVGQPGHRQRVTGAVHHRQQLLPGPVREHLRMPAMRPARRQRVGGHRGLNVPEERATAIGPGRQPGPVELAAQLTVDPYGRLIQVEALHARGGCWPRHSQRHRHFGPDQAHIPLEVPQRHRLQAEALAIEPPKVIHQQIGVSPLRPRSVIPAQEPVRFRVHRPLRPHDRPRPPSTPPRQLLHPELTDHNLTSHPASLPIPANMADVPNQVGK